LKQNSDALQYISKTADIWHDKEFVLSTVKLCGNALQYASEDLKGYTDVVLAAVGQNRSAFEYVNKNANIWLEKDFGLPMVEPGGTSLQHAVDNLERELSKDLSRDLSRKLSELSRELSTTRV